MLPRNGVVRLFERMIDSGEAVTVIVSSEKFIILTEPTGRWTCQHVMLKRIG